MKAFRKLLTQQNSYCGLNLLSLTVSDKILSDRIKDIATDSLNRLFWWVAIVGVIYLVLYLILFAFGVVSFASFAFTAITYVNVVIWGAARQSNRKFVR